MPAAEGIVMVLRPGPATVLALASLLVVVHSGGAGAQAIESCAHKSFRGYCAEWVVSTPPSRSSPVNAGRPASACRWVSIPEDLSRDSSVWTDFGLDRPPPGVVVAWQSWECSDGSPGYDFRWVVAASPEDLATLARGRLVGQLPQPVLETAPPLGTSSIVGVPVFVAVANWTGLVSASECAGGLCVTVTATPALMFEPGEPGSEPVACAGAGSEHVPGGPAPEVQASAPGACSWTYRMRTGAAGRPSVWPGEVSVTWTLAWSASSGASGSLPPVTRSAGLPRAVAEVQTVVAGGATP